MKCFVRAGKCVQLVKVSHLLCENNGGHERNINYTKVNTYLNESTKGADASVVVH